MSSTTYLSGISASGKVTSTAQGVLMGSFDTMPTASEANLGVTVLYTGPSTGDFVINTVYKCTTMGPGLYAWTACPIGANVDTAISGTSTNPVQNKAISAALDAKVDKAAGKQLSTEDYTSAEKTKLAGVATGAEVNAIDTIKVKDANGTTPMTPTAKAVTIDLSNYARLSDITTVLKYKGTVASYSALPASPAQGDVYNITAADSTHGVKAGDNVAWTGSEWDVLSGTVDLSSYVTLSGTQALTNKTINGYTLGAACAKAVGSVVSGNTGLVTGGDVYTALQNMGGGAEIYVNKSASSWTADTTYSDYGYRCAIAISGVTANDVAWVSFDTAQAISGDYAPVCDTYAGGVYIYSVTNNAITIPSIVVFKG